MARRKGPSSPSSKSPMLPQGQQDTRTSASSSSKIPDASLKIAVDSRRSPDPAAVAPTPPEMDDSGTCFICAEPILYYSVGICGHNTCQKTQCTFCKTSLPSLLFTRSVDTSFPSDHHITPSPPDRIAAALAKADKLEKGQKWDKGLVLPGTLDMEAFEFHDEKIGVVFEDEEMMQDTLTLLRFNCPYPDCAYQAAGWDSLEKHTLGAHGLALCRLCRSLLNRFAHEQGLYPPHLLALHDPSQLARGQRPPRPRPDEVEMVKSWDAPHPMCEFCHEAYFGPEELRSHMRNKHQECFVCKQLGENDIYFANFARLEAHFHHDHFACTDPSCLELKFQVFGSEMDLKAHMMTEHAGQMNARDRAQARHLQIDFGAPEHHGRAGSSRQANRNAGGDFSQSGQNSRVSRMRDIAPHQQQVSEPQPMAPAQAAQQRRQVQTDRQEDSKRKRQFETGLTLPEGQTPSRSQPASGYATPREDEGAVSDRHLALLARVSLLVSHSDVKMTSFRSAVRQYRVNESGPRDLVDTVFNVLDQNLDATAGVVRETASIFDSEGDKDKNTALLSALNGWRVEQNDAFPALSSAPTGLGSNYAGIASGTILNIKRSTHSRGHSSQAVWDRVEAAASSHPVNRPPNPNQRYVPGTGRLAGSSFPSLAGPSASKPLQHSTPWAGGGSGSASKSPPALTGPIIRSVNFPTAAPSKSKPPSQAAFPSLPASSKSTAAEKRALFSKPNARAESIQRITGKVVPQLSSNGWGTSAGITDGLEGLQVSEARDGVGQGGNDPVVEERLGAKKKGKQKQLLFSVSARPG